MTKTIAVEGEIYVCRESAANAYSDNAGFRDDGGGDGNDQGGIFAPVFYYGDVADLGPHQLLPLDLYARQDPSSL